MSFTTDLLTGFAALLADASIGLTWRLDGAGYLNSETGLFLLAMPPSPDRLVSLATYGIGDDGAFADSDVGLQVRCRSGADDPRDVFALDDSVADVLLGNYPLTLSTGVRVTSLVRASSVPLGQDDTKRWSYSSNYYLGLHRPGSHRL